MKYAISSSYNATTVGYANFPEGKTWNDVNDWYVKWDTLHVEFKGEPEWHEFELNSGSGEIDWKRPSSTSVHPTDEEGNPDYDEELAESS